MLVETYIEQSELNKDILQFLVDNKFVDTKTNVRRIIENNGLRINGNLIKDITKSITKDDFVNGKMILKIGLFKAFEIKVKEI